MAKKRKFSNEFKAKVALKAGKACSTAGYALDKVAFLKWLDNF